MQIYTFEANNREKKHTSVSRAKLVEALPVHIETDCLRPIPPRRACSQASDVCQGSVWN